MWGGRGLSWSRQPSRSTLRRLEDRNKHRRGATTKNTSTTTTTLTASTAALQGRAGASAHAGRRQGIRPLLRGRERPRQRLAGPFSQDFGIARGRSILAGGRSRVGLRGATIEACPRSPGRTRRRTSRSGSRAGASRRSSRCGSRARRSPREDPRDLRGRARTWASGSRAAPRSVALSLVTQGAYGSHAVAIYKNRTSAHICRRHAAPS